MLMFFRNLARLEKCLCQQMKKFCTATEIASTEPIISSSELIENSKFFYPPREAWIESLDTIEDKKLGIIKLHPDVFGTMPRTDIVYENVRWQRLYGLVNYLQLNTRAECPGGGRKPWPQKGTGRARHGSIRSPLWIRGGRAHGPRAYTTHFFMLPFYTRVRGLTAALSIKFHQDDLHIVENLEIPSNEPSYLQELMDQRNWGPSMLIVDKYDIIPENIALAMHGIKHVNIMPVYGMNVYSLLKHTTVVLTRAAVREIEEKIMFHMNRMDRKIMEKYRVNQQ